MPDTFVKIASVTVGSGGASSIDFTSIPQTYTDLCVKVSTRNNASANNYTIKFNGSSVSAYSDRILYANGSSAASGVNTTSGAGVYGQMNPSTYTANTFDSGEIYIPNYTGSNNKSVSIDNVQESNAAGVFMSIIAGLWSNTSAITSITLTPISSAAYVQYSTATLYGIKNS